MLAIIRKKILFVEQKETAPCYAFCMHFLRERWYVLPTISGFLLILASPPFSLGVFGFFALTPLFYAVIAYPSQSRTQTFWSGFVTAGLAVFSLYYLTLFQFHWLPGSEGLVFLVRAGIIPATFLGGAALGVGLVLYRALRTTYLVYNALLGGMAYFLLEWIFTMVFEGYNTFTLAYSTGFISHVMHIAALGGVPLVSFVVATTACFIAEATRAAMMRGFRQLAVPVIVFAGIVLSMSITSELFIKKDSTSAQEISIAIIQPGSYSQHTFGISAEGSFSFPQFLQQFPSASFAGADFAFYPLSFFDGALYRGVSAPSTTLPVITEEEVGKWIASTFASSTIVATWDSVYEGPLLYNEYQFWQRGKTVAKYQKHDLHFLDNTSSWFGQLGFYQTQFFYSPAQDSIVHPVAVGGVHIGTAICSELMRDDLLRAQAHGSDFLLFMGSEAGLDDTSISLLSLRAAQYRAVEYNVPAIRVDAVGPSAIIDGSGAIIARASWNKPMVLRGVLFLRTPNKTPYARFGSTPVYALFAVLLIIALGVYRLTPRFLVER